MNREPDRQQAGGHEPDVGVGGRARHGVCRCFDPAVVRVVDPADVVWEPLVRSPEDKVRELLEDAVVREATLDLDRPHVVVIEDPLGNMLHEGPYPTALDALLAADARQQEYAVEWPEDDIATWITVSPLTPPILPD